MHQNLLSKDIQQFWSGAGHLCPDDPAQLSLSMFSSEHSLCLPSQKGMLTYFGEFGAQKCCLSVVGYHPLKQ